MSDSKPYHVRMATPDDEEQLMVLCRLLASENALFPMDEELVLELLRSVLIGKQGFIGVIGEPGHLEGSILMRLSTMWYSRAPVLEEYWNFVHPDYRNSHKETGGLNRPGRAQYLVKFAKSCAKKLSVPLLIGVVSNHRTEAKVRLYDRELPRAGAFYLYRGDQAESAESSIGYCSHGHALVPGNVEMRKDGLTCIQCAKERRQKRREVERQKQKSKFRYNGLRV